MRETSNTAVLCGSSPGWAAHLAFGRPVGTQAAAHGRWLLLPPHSIAAYCVSSDRTRTFVFRTESQSGPVSTAIPGVSGTVSLLIELRTRGRFYKLLKLFSYLQREGFEPSQLSDAFFLKVGSLLLGRLPPFPLLPVMLENEKAARGKPNA